MNALLMAGVLPQGDDDNPNASSIPKRETAKKVEADIKQAGKEEKETKNQLLSEVERMGEHRAPVEVFESYGYAAEAYRELWKEVNGLLKKF